MVRFDIYQLTDRVFSRYGEMRVAEELEERGLDVFAPLNDSYIDLVARIRRCKDCRAHWDHLPEQSNQCQDCGSQRFSVIFKTIQVKSSRVEGGGDDNTYGVDHKPKDMLHDKRHYIVWVFYDRRGREHFQCCRLEEFVVFSNGTRGHFCSNHTWRTNRGRYHMTMDERTGGTTTIPPANRHTLDYLLDQHNASVNEIINQQEVENDWNTTTGFNFHVVRFRFENNKDFLINTLRALTDANGNSVIPIINQKSRIWRILNDEPISFHVSPRLDDSRLGRSRFTKKILKKMFKLSMQGWVGLTNVSNVNDIIMMRMRCKNCKKLWDQEEKECYRCKTWSAPVYICQSCGVGVPQESKRGCANCKTARGAQFCMQCGAVFRNAAGGGGNRTYFVPITFCQNCGMRENEFEFKELK